MNTITFSTFSHTGANKVGKLLPAIITVDGEPAFIIGKAEDIIVISDLHIRVRNMLKALEKRARAGMPKPVKITTEMV